ncbi:MAG: NAD(P)H-hydrate epimerase, partial [Odoribacter sp.]|nr:NAD(P)H-hydrate epimerase [Odoribacter sp.]
MTARMPEIDKFTIEHEPITSLELMERASRIWSECFLEKFPSVSSVAVLAGCGNNGGDGFAIARMLKAQGVEVMVWQLKTGNRISLDCEANAYRWKEVGGEVSAVCLPEDLNIKEDAVVVDAIFGSGLNRRITGLVAEVIRRLNTLKNTVVAVDIPSGLLGENNADNDRSAIVQADYTFTFQYPKLAFFLPENACYVGEWSVLDIGLHPAATEVVSTDWYYTTAEVVAVLLPPPGKFDHKGVNGRGLLIAGSYGMMGGAVLAARAAVCSGIGLLHCHLPQRGGDVMQVAVPEAVLDVDDSPCCFSGEQGKREYDA